MILFGSEFLKRSFYSITSRLAQSFVELMLSDIFAAINMIMWSAPMKLAIWEQRPNHRRGNLGTRPVDRLDFSLSDRFNIGNGVLRVP